MTTLNEYQQAARQTAIYPDNYSVVYPTLGLTGEAGEVSDKVKKIIRDKGGVFDVHDDYEIAKELGDVLWYLANLASDLGYSLDDVARFNIEKLKSRAERNVLQGSGDNR